MCNFAAKKDKKNQMTRIIHHSCLKVVLILLTAIFTLELNGQRGDYNFGIHVNPLVGWFGCDVRSVENAGSKAGVNVGVDFNSYFADNYAFSTGISLISTGGKLVYGDTTSFTLFSGSQSEETTIPANRPIVYRVQYLSVPLGLRFRSTQIGYVTFFANVGVDPKVVVGRKVDIPILNVEREKASEELRLFNMGYHINGGIEYSVGGNTSMLVGLGFENNFFDVTKDINRQPRDRITHRLLSLQLGVIF